MSTNLVRGEFEAKLLEALAALGQETPVPPRPQ